MHLESHPEAAVPQPLRHQIHALHNEAWPHPPSRTPATDAPPDDLVREAAPTFHHTRIPLHPGHIDKLW
ncbi:hypothetical protein [Kribbella sp. C-35]|uniref:hypothetical protein n=1 Tax=Kribbella sp. C-35 TaxID=2789276 RepID=UPI00397E3757